MLVIGLYLTVFLQLRRERRLWMIKVKSSRYAG